MSRAEIEQTIIKYAFEVSGETIDSKTPLMDAGMDSLAASALAENIGKHWNIELSPTLLFDHPTIADISGHILDKLAMRKTEPVSVAEDKPKISTKSQNKLESMRKEMEARKTAPEEVKPVPCVPPVQSENTGRSPSEAPSQGVQNGGVGEPNDESNDD